MVATFCIPTSLQTLESISIFVDGELFDTVDNTTTEYYSSEISTDATITAGTEESPVNITTFEIDLIERVRLLSKITEDELSDDEVILLFPLARRTLMLELCRYTYGEEISLIRENYYKLPNKFFFDYNCGGKVSTLDVEVFTQTLPIYEYTTKDPVTVIGMDVKDGWIQLDAQLPGTQILKINYYYLQREAKYEDMLNLLSYAIASLYYTDAYNTYSTGVSEQIKIGDITIKHSTESVSIGYLTDRMNKCNAQLTMALKYFKRGFYRIK